MLGLGLSAVAILPASLGLSIELTFPLPPPLVNGVLMMLANISAVLQSLTYSKMMDVDPSEFEGDEKGLQYERVRKV